MKKMKIIAIIVALAATAMIALTACGDKDKIVGTWYNPDRYQSVTFYNDGKLVIGSDTGSWELNGNKIKITSPYGQVTEEEYSLDGNTLTFAGERMVKQ